MKYETFKRGLKRRNKFGELDLFQCFENIVAIYRLPFWFFAYIICSENPEI